MGVQWLTSAGGLAEPFQMDGTAKETWANDKISCEVQLRCPWDDRYDVLDNILLNCLAWPYHATPVSYATGGTISNVPTPSILNAPSGLDYSEAYITVSFESLNKKDNQDTGDTVIYEESIEPSAQFLTLPPDNFRWSSTSGDHLKKEEAPGRLEIGLDYVVSFSNLSAIPAAAFSLIGKVNSGQVRSPTLNRTFSNETLLYNPPKITQKITVKGDNKFTMQCRYTHQPAGWNTFWRAKTGAYEQIYDIDGGGSAYKNFTPASFAGMVP